MASPFAPKHIKRKFINGKHENPKSEAFASSLGDMWLLGECDFVVGGQSGLKANNPNYQVKTTLHFFASHLLSLFLSCKHRVHAKRVQLGRHPSMFQTIVA